MIDRWTQNPIGMRSIEFGASYQCLQVPILEDIAHVEGIPDPGFPFTLFLIPDSEAEGDTLTFRYREINPGGSVLLDDIAIITGMIYNTKHERANDTMMK